MAFQRLRRHFHVPEVERRNHAMQLMTFRGRQKWSQSGQYASASLFRAQALNFYLLQTLHAHWLLKSKQSFTCCFHTSKVLCGVVPATESSVTIIENVWKYWMRMLHAIQMVDRSRTIRPHMSSMASVSTFFFGHGKQKHILMFSYFFTFST